MSVPCRLVIVGRDLDTVHVFGTLRAGSKVLSCRVSCRLPIGVNVNTRIGINSEGD